MNALQLFFKEYFMVRRWFFHHILIGLLVWLVVWAAVMWLATDKYFDDEASATVVTNAAGDADDNLDFTSQGSQVLLESNTVQKTTIQRSSKSR